MIELHKFKLTLPVGKPGKPREVFPVGAYQSPPWFVQSASGSVWFRAPVDGVTTSGSSYPRSELREMHGQRLARWSNRGRRTHTLRGRCAVTELPGRKREVVVAQIHDAKDDVVMLLVSGSTVWLSKSRGKGKGADKHPLDVGYALNDVIDYTITATRGRIHVLYTRDGHQAALSIKRRGRGFYFKAGAYSQANHATGTGYAEVRYDLLEVVHT